MSKKIIFPVLLVFSLIASACDLATPAAPTAIPTTTMPAPTATVATPTQTAIFTPFPTFTLTPAATDTLAPVTPVSIPASPNYIDDRSTPSQVIVSYYNAISRQEYLRAYSYYDDPATSLGSYTSFANGYQNTASVDLVFGAISADPGMSQIYFTIPVLLKVTNKDSTHSNFAACYVVHETNPDVYGAPPFAPMGIFQGSAQPSSSSTSDSAALATACNGTPSGMPGSVPASGGSLSIDKSNFLDNRSGPVETVSSFLNAINLKQYVRAYIYFQDPATFPGPYDPWAAGYANTDTITVTFGTFTSEGAAGSLYYKVPLALKVLTTASSTQTFVGCYTLRLSQPAVQGTPPFRPMGIVSGKFTQVSNSTDVVPMLATACN
jgi:hypothetical protein